VHGTDFGALEPCAYCQEGHAPGFCWNPDEHDVDCLLDRRRCPCPCLVVCVLSITCPRCRVGPGEECSAAGTWGAVHDERRATADQTAVGKTPAIITAAWGQEGLGALRRLIERQLPERTHSPEHQQLALQPPSSSPPPERDQSKPAP
jgi:hypothetical protein